MEEVFISYARESAMAARAAATALLVSGHNVWMDDDIPAHREYADVISERIDGAKAVLVIWSEAAAKSQWVRSEANRGRELGKLVQLTIDDCRLPMPFDQIQCANLAGWSGNVEEPGWRQVLSGIDALSNGSSRSAKDLAVPAREKASVAVLPFRDLSPAKDQDYFCEGICEEILTGLTRLPGLRVASSSPMPAGATPKEVGRMLGVTTLLEGSVRKSGERARIAARLVQAQSGFALWAVTFDRDLGDIFELQDEIARSVVAALGVKLLPGEDAGLGVGGSKDATAYDLYLRAKALVRRELETERRRATELFHEAIRRDPEFSLAYASLADVLVELARLRPDDWSKLTEEAAQMARKAVELSPDLAEAHLALGGALRLNHDPGAAVEYEKAVALNPQDPNVHYRFAKFLVIEGEKRRAIEHYERAFDLAPDDYRYIIYTLQEYQALEDKEGEQSALARAWPVIEKHLRLYPDDIRALVHGAGALALLGRSAECHEFMDRAFAARSDDFGNLANLACAAMLNNEPELALDYLERGVATGRGDKEWLLEDNDLKPLHGNPRFEALVSKMV